MTNTKCWIVEGSIAPKSCCAVVKPRSDSLSTEVGLPFSHSVTFTGLDHSPLGEESRMFSPEVAFCLLISDGAS